MEKQSTLVDCPSPNYHGGGMTYSKEKTEGTWNRRRWIAAATGVTGLSDIDDMVLAFNPASRGIRRSGTPRVEGPRSRMKISSFKVTLVASPDYALLNSWTVHDTHFKRTILELETADGYTGISEVWGGALNALEFARDLVLGHDPFEIEFFRQSLSHRRGLTQLESSESFAAVEIACLDLIGKVIDRRVVDLIGGPFRQEAPFSAYNFFVMPIQDGPDITTPEALAQSFLDFHQNHGFTTCKFKGGVFEPDLEIEALARIRKTMPKAKLRIDPNAAWSVETSIKVAGKLESLDMEYLEDPTQGQDGMAKVRQHTSIPLATNMCVTKMDDIRPGYEKGAIDIVLLDPHHMGGLNNVRYWAATCKALGWGCSGHSNNYLGISMATQIHMGCAISHITHDVDSHYPWTTHDIIRGDMLQFHNGKMALPNAPGLGVEIDPEKKAMLADNVSRTRSRHDLLHQWNPSYPSDRQSIRW